MDYVLDECVDGREGLRLDRAFALHAYTRANNPWMSYELASDGYIAQESYKIRKMA